MPLRDIFVTAVVFGLLPFILTRSWLGVLLWSWIGYMNPHRLTWSFAYTFPFAAIVAIPTLISLFFSKDPKRFPVTPVTVVLLMFILWMNVTTIFATNVDEALPQWDKVMKIQLMALVTLFVMHGQKKIHMLAWVITASIAFFGIKGGIFTITRGGAFHVLGPPGSFIEGNTEISLALLMVLPLMRYLQLQATQKWLRWGIGVSMVLVTFSIVGSYSRGALVGGIAIAVFLWFKSRQKLLMAMALAVVLPLVLMFMPQQWADKMHTTVNYQEDGSAMGRINAWWFAWNLAKDNPLVGGGFETFRPALFYAYAPDPNDFHDAHSIYFEVLGEHGFVGLGLFLLLGILVWRTGTWIIRNTRGHPELKWASELAAMIQVGLVGYAVGGAFLGLAYYDLYYGMAAMLVLTQVHVRDQLAARERPVLVQPVRSAWPGGGSESGWPAPGRSLE